MNKIATRKTISIVTPCFNEEDSILKCVTTIQTIFEKKLPEYDFEHIFCDNCSSDRTVDILKDLARMDRRIKIIVNSRNFGILKNTFNGVLSSNGDAVVLFMPVDLQDPPELIEEFVRHWEDGYEIVYGIRASREENFITRTARKTYYRVLSRLSYVEYPPDAGDFQLVDRKVISAMKLFDDAAPFMRMMTFDCGFRSIGVSYTWRRRQHGASRNKILDMIGQGMNGMVSFSTAPVRFSLFAGMLISFLSISYSVGIALLTLFHGIRISHGIPTVIVAIFFLGGIQLFFIGVVGEYVLAIYNQVRRRPLVIERQRINFDDNVEDKP